MKKAAMILGIIGGICGLPWLYASFGTLSGILTGNMSPETTLTITAPQGTWTWNSTYVTYLLLLAIFAIPICSFLGGIIVRTKPVLGGFLMTASVAIVFSLILMLSFDPADYRHAVIGATFFAMPASLGAIFAFLGAFRAA